MATTTTFASSLQSGSDQEENRRLSRQLQQLQQANAKEMKAKVGQQYQGPTRGYKHLGTEYLRTHRSEPLLFAQLVYTLAFEFNDNVAQLALSRTSFGSASGRSVQFYPVIAVTVTAYSNIDGIILAGRKHCERGCPVVEGGRAGARAGVGSEVSTAGEI